MSPPFKKLCMVLRICRKHPPSYCEWDAVSPQQCLGALGPREKIISEKGEMYGKNRSLCKQAIWTLQFCLGRAWSYASSCVSSSPWPTLPRWIMNWEWMFGSKPRTDWVTCGWQQVTQKGVGCPALVKITLQTSQLPRRKSERQEWGGPFLHSPLLQPPEDARSRRGDIRTWSGWSPPPHQLWAASPQSSCCRPPPPNSAELVIMLPEWGGAGGGGLTQEDLFILSWKPGMLLSEWCL